MAALTDFHIKSMGHVKLRVGRGATVGVYAVELVSTSDTITLPSNYVTSGGHGCVSLTQNITATAATADEGETVITFGGSAAIAGAIAVFAIRHRDGLNNNLGRDEDPT